MRVIIRRNGRGVCETKEGWRRWWRSILAAALGNRLTAEQRAYQFCGPAERGTRAGTRVIPRAARPAPTTICIYMHRVAALPINYLKLINLGGWVWTSGWEREEATALVVHHNPHLFGGVLSPEISVRSHTRDSICTIYVCFWQPMEFTFKLSALRSFDVSFRKLENIDV